MLRGHNGDVLHVAFSPDGKQVVSSSSDGTARVAGTEFDENAKCPQFEQFVFEVCNQDNDLVRYMQTVLGYGLTGCTDEQKMFILYGVGSNGKGTLVETIKAIMGDYAKTAQADTLMQKSTASGSNASPDVARLAEARFVFLSEGSRSHKFDEALVKQMTGEDTITARELYKTPFEFKPKFKLMLSTNYRPKIRGTDEGIWRRMAPIPFDASFTREKQDKRLRNKLAAENSGILNWLLEGCTRWQQEGLIEPTAVSKAIKSYRNESDNVARFLEYRTDAIPDAKVPKCPTQN